MSNCHCNSLSCGRVNSSTCGWVASDSTPACNPCAPWGRAGDSTCQCGRCNRWGCGSIAGDSTWGCNTWGCSSCGSCGLVAGDSTCGCGDSCGTGADGGYLVPRLTSIGRTFQRRITQTLCIDDLPGSAEPPFTLVGVTVSGQASWEQISECRQQLLRVTVPVAVQIRDCGGRLRTGHTTVTLTIPLCRRCPPQDFWRGQLYVAPCIRLAAPVTENEDGCFDATLEVQAEVYLVRMQIVN